MLPRLSQEAVAVPQRRQTEKECPLPGLGRSSCPRSGGGACVTHRHMPWIGAPGAGSRVQLLWGWTHQVPILPFWPTPPFSAPTPPRPDQLQPRVLLSCGAALEAALPQEGEEGCSLQPDCGPSTAPPAAPWSFSGSGGLLAGRRGRSVHAAGDAPLVVTQGSRAAWGQGTEPRKRQSLCGASLGHFHCVLQSVGHNWSGKAGPGWWFEKQ